MHTRTCAHTSPLSKVRVKCNEDDTIGDLKKLVAAQTGTRPEKIRIQKWCARPRGGQWGASAWAAWHGPGAAVRAGRAPYHLGRCGA